MLRLLPVTLLCACVLPLPIEGEPVSENFPPFFDPGSLTPKPRDPGFDPEVSDTQEWCVHGVADPNETDRLYKRWFINYGARVTFPLEFESQGGRGQVEGGHTFCFSVKPCVNAVFPDVENTRTLHTVELIVADRPFKDNADLEEGELPFQTVTEGGRHVRATWFLQFDKPCPPPE